MITVVHDAAPRRTTPRIADKGIIREDLLGPHDWRGTACLSTVIITKDRGAREGGR